MQYCANPYIYCKLQNIIKKYARTKIAQNMKNYASLMQSEFKFAKLFNYLIFDFTELFFEIAKILLILRTSMCVYSVK